MLTGIFGLLIGFILGVAYVGATFDRKVRELHAALARRVTLPTGYQWGSDAMESFNFGVKCAADAIEKGFKN